MPDHQGGDMGNCTGIKPWDWHAHARTLTFRKPSEEHEPPEKTPTCTTRDAGTSNFIKDTGWP
eukprot:14052151-Alexandrium_andersonii.AAC.1